MSTSLPRSGVLVGPSKPDRHEGKEANPWNLHLRSPWFHSIFAPSVWFPHFAVGN